MKKMKSLMLFCVSIFAVSTIVFASGGGNGNASNGGNDDSVGPLNDNKSSQGALYGDMYVILRYLGGETKLIPDPSFNIEEAPDGIQEMVEGPLAVGGEPMLSSEYGWYVKEIDSESAVSSKSSGGGEDDSGDVTYVVAKSPYPCQCVQPVASFERWGDIWKNWDGEPDEKPQFNVLPLVVTYDAQWDRSECEVGQVVGEPTVGEDGELDIVVDKYFIQPGERWKDPINGWVTYTDGVLWTDLIQEVHFGRLNLSRSPEAVLQAAFDEAIIAINNAESISLDASGRLVLKTKVYSELEVNKKNGLPVYLEEVEKAVDSPLENLALYVKLMKDGHLVTPGNERAPIDRSIRGGIPLWKMLDLEDGPSTELRPTIDIKKLRTSAAKALNLNKLVNVSAARYYTYYLYYDSDGDLCEYLPDGTIDCPDADQRVLKAVPECPYPEELGICEGPFYGIMENDGGQPKWADFKFAASFLAAAADKTGQFSMDMIVYLNSILDINKVIGYSAYDEDGNPAVDAIDYNENPVYFNFGDYFPRYDRIGVFGGRVASVLVGSSPYWEEQSVNIYESVSFRNLGLRKINRKPNNRIAAKNILGFTQMADDNLSVIDFIHTYQIPGLR